MKLALVEPVLVGDKNYSLGVLNLATILREAKLECEVVRLQSLLKHNPVKADTYHEILGNYILDLKVNIVGFSCTCENYHIWIQTAEFIKAKNEEICIFFGGPQATLTAHETLSKFEFIDFIMLGESETNIVEAIETILNQEEISKVPGIAYREMNQIKISTELNLILNLDNLPFPDYTLLENFKKIDVISIEAGRGCPFGCTYCSSKSFWKQKFRLKSVDRLIEELKIVVNNYNKRKFDFVHDLFTLNKKYILEFCKKIIDMDLDIEWTCSSRVDVIDKEMLYYMKKAGCNNIFFGIETGSERMQKNINKNLKLETIDQLLLDLQEVNFENARFAFMCGFPEETLDDLRQTGKLIDKIMKYKFSKGQLCKCTILPKTEMYYNYLDQLVYTNKVTAVTDNIGVTNAQQLIMENKEVFPQFFEIPSSINEFTYGFEKFMNLMFFSGFSDLYKGTLFLLLTYFKGDYIELYNCWTESSTEDVQLIFNLDSYMQEDQLEVDKQLYEFLLKEIKSLINKNTSIVNLDIMQEIIEYEETLFRCLTEQKEYIKTFTYDVTRMRSLSEFCIEKKHTKVLIRLTQQNQVEIKKYKENRG